MVETGGPAKVEEHIVEERTYRLSRAGRRMAYLLLVGAVIIWGFALWTLKNTLQLGFRPQNILPSLQNLWGRIIGAEGAQPLTAAEAIPSLVMLVLLVVIPLLVWNIIEELRSSITMGADGITFRSLGIELAYPWEEVANLRPVDEEAEDPLDELVLRTSRLPSIHNPLIRFLHWQAYGRYRLPIYGGLENREELIESIRPRLALAEEAALVGMPNEGGGVGGEESAASVERAAPESALPEGADLSEVVSAKPTQESAPEGTPIEDGEQTAEGEAPTITG